MHALFIGGPSDGHRIHEPLDMIPPATVRLDGEPYHLMPQLRLGRDFSGHEMPHEENMLFYVHATREHQSIMEALFFGYRDAQVDQSPSGSRPERA